MEHRFIHKIIIYILIFVSFIIAIEIGIDNSNFTNIGLYQFDITNITNNSYFKYDYDNFNITPAFNYQSMVFKNDNDNILIYKKSLFNTTIKYKIKRWDFSVALPLTDYRDFYFDINYDNKKFGNFITSFKTTQLPMKFIIFDDYSLNSYFYDIKLYYSKKILQDLIVSSKISYYTYNIDNQSYHSTINPEFKLKYIYNKIESDFSYKYLIFPKSDINLNNNYFNLLVNPAFLNHNFTANIKYRNYKYGINYNKIKTISKFEYLNKYFDLPEFSSNTFLGHFWLNLNIVNLYFKYQHNIKCIKNLEIKYKLNYLIANYYYNTFLYQRFGYGFLNTILQSKIYKIKYNQFIIPAISARYNLNKFYFVIDFKTFIPIYQGQINESENIVLNIISDKIDTKTNLHLPLSVNLKINILL